MAKQVQAWMSDSGELFETEEEASKQDMLAKARECFEASVHYSLGSLRFENVEQLCEFLYVNNWWIKPLMKWEK